MSRHCFNLFAIENLADLKCEYRFVKVSLPEDETYEKNVELLRKNLIYELKQPVALVSTRPEIIFTIPRDTIIQKSEYQVIRHIAELRPENLTHHLSFNKLESKSLPVALSFLEYSLRSPLMKDVSLWGRSHRYFEKEPLSLGSLSTVDIYEGFIFSVVPANAILFLSIDIVNRYVDKLWLMERANGRQLLDYRGKHLVYHSKNWFEIQLVNPLGKSIREQRFPDKNTGQPIDVYTYTKNHFPYNSPDYIRNLNPDSEAILYRYPGKESEKYYGAAALCKLKYSTDAPEVRKLHQKTILSPTERFERIEKILENYFQKTDLNGIPIKISKKPLEKKKDFFYIPDQIFGKGQVLHVCRNREDHGVSYLSLGKERIKLLFDKDAGPLNTTPFDAQYIISPETLPRDIQEDYIERLKCEVQKLNPNPYNPKRVVYSNNNCKTLYKQFHAIKIALDNANIKQGYALIVLPEDAKPDLHDYIKRELWPNFQFQCAQEQKIKQHYAPQVDNGITRYNVKEEFQQKYKSYIKNTTFGLLQVNRKWLWALKTPLNYDVYIGIDVLNKIAGFTFIYNNGKDCYFRDYRCSQKERLSRRQIFTILSKALKEDLRHLKLSPGSIVIHRDGRTGLSEIDGAQDAFKALKREGILPSDVITGIVEIRKTRTYHVRLVEGRTDTPYDNSTLGSYFLLSSKEAIVCNTGRPFISQGTVKPLHAVIADGNLDIKKVIEDIFNLSQLIWSSPDKCGRLPVTIRLADDLLEPIASKFELDEAIYESEWDEKEELEDDSEMNMEVKS
ncbi:MAG: hypothetical protein AB1638_00895 [Nitrospirota bacterium]